MSHSREVARITEATSVDVLAADTYPDDGRVAHRGPDEIVVWGGEIGLGPADACRLAAGILAAVDLLDPPGQRAR